MRYTFLKILSLTLALQTLCAAAGQDKEPLFLVVGSTRPVNKSLTPQIDKVYGIDEVDMSHARTFGGNATTMDLLPSCVAGARHIKADAQKFNFLKFDVKSVLLERLPTISDQFNPSIDSGYAGKNLLEQNYIGDCIRQLASAMQPGTLLEIEWLPCTSLVVDESIIEGLTRKNPFHGFVNLNVFLQGVFILGGDDNLRILPAHLKASTLAMAKKICEDLGFYYAQGAGPVEDLLSRIYAEAFVLLSMIREEPMVLFDYDFFKDDDLKKLISAKDKAVYRVFPTEFLGKNLVSNIGNGIVYNEQTFLEGSFLNFVLENIAAENNVPYVKAYLEANGFGNVSIERTTNPHNYRKNVWMVRANRS